MKKYTIGYEGTFTRLANGKIGREHKTAFIYANNDFEAGCELGSYTSFEGNATIEKVEELKPIKVKYTCWTGERDEERVKTCYGTLEDAKRQIGGGMNCFDFEIVEE